MAVILLCINLFSFSGYELERKNYPGQFVDLSSDLKSQGTMDFVLKHIREQHNVSISIS